MNIGKLDRVKMLFRGATIAQWIRLHLSSCCTGFESKAHHLRFTQFIFTLCHVQKTKINPKEAGITLFLKKMFLTHTTPPGCTPWVPLFSLHSISFWR